MRYIDENENEISELDIDLTKGCIIDTQVIKPDAKPIDNETKFAWADDDYEPVKMYIKHSQRELDEIPYFDAMSKLNESDYIFAKLMEDLVAETHGITDLIAIFARYAEEYGDTIKSRKEWRQIVRDLKPKIDSE